MEAHDKHLWYQLIEHSLRNEAFLSGLLDHAGVYDVDLTRLVAEIPKGMYILGLRDKVVKIISDYRFQVNEWGLALLLEQSFYYDTCTKCNQPLARVSYELPCLSHRVGNCQHLKICWRSKNLQRWLVEFPRRVVWNGWTSTWRRLSED